MFPREFEIRLRKRQVIPFVGAGVSRAVLRPDGHPLFPDWRDLLLGAAARLQEEGKAPKSQVVEGLVKQDRPDFLDAARHAQEGLGPLWAGFLKQELDPPSIEADPKSLALASALWGLGSPLLVTTNYDKVLQWACPEPSARDLVFWDIEAKVEQSQLLQSWLPPRPTVWHLHGRIDNAAELILTFDGYQRLYGNGSSKSRYQAALTTFRALLAARSLLFVGFSFDDEALGVQLQGVRDLFAGTVGPHYALVRETDLQRVRSLDLPLELVSFAGFGDLVPLVHQLGEIAKQGDRSLGGSPSISPAAASPGAAYSTDNRPFFVPFRPKGDKVIGADVPLQRVREQLTRRGPTNIGQTAAFEGLGGLGKTQLAVEYAWRYQDHYPNGVIWLTADQDIPAQLTRLAVEAKWIPAESEHKLKLEVAQHRVRSYSDCLIVFDNLEDLASIQPYLPLPTAHPHLLVTSRTEQPGFVPVPLGVLDREQSLAVLISEAGRSPVGEEEQRAAQEIADDLGGLPLALEMAGAFLLYRPVQWQQYRNLLRSNPKEALRGRFLTSFTGHEADLYATLRIQEELFEDEPLLKEVLDVLTWSGSAPMGVSLLAALLVVEPPALLGSLSLGTQLRLLERSADVDRFGLHRLVRKVRQEDEPLGGRTVWTELISRRLGDWFAARRRDFSDLTTFEAEIDHLDAWRQQAESLSLTQECRLTWLLAYPPFHRGQYQEALRWLSKAQALQDKIADSELSAWIWSDLGTINSAVGAFQEGLECAKRGLGIRRAILGLEHPDTALSFDNIGTTYLFLDDAARALDHHTQALEIRRKALGEQHPDTARSLDNIGVDFRKCGEWEKALTYHMQALAIRRQTLGGEHPDTARSLANVGLDFDECGEGGKALDHYTQALAIQRKALGGEHPEIAYSLASGGNILRGRGEWLMALSYDTESLTIARKTLGEEHPLTGGCLHNIGLDFKGLGEMTKALDYFLQALDNRKKVLGEEHPETAETATAIGFIHFKFRQLEEALGFAKLALEIRRRTLGQDNTKTISSMLDVAITLESLGRRDEALRLLAPLITKPPSDPADAKRARLLIQNLRAQPARPGFRPSAAPSRGKKRKKRR